MIKVHSWKADLKPIGLKSTDDANKLESFCENITIWYDPGHLSLCETKRFVIVVPEFIVKKTGRNYLREDTAEEVFDRLEMEYSIYLEAMTPKSKTKIILYSINMHGARYQCDETGKVTHCDFRYGGNSCSEQVIQQHLKVEIEWRVRWMVKQNNKYWLETDDGRNSGSFNLDQSGSERWMYWTPEREAFFEKFSGIMLDLIGTIHAFFGSNQYGLIDGLEVAKYIDSGKFPTIEGKVSND